MPKCLDCGHTESFYVAQISWDKLFYDGEDIYDSKNVDMCDAGEPAECGSCNSTNVEGI